MTPSLITPIINGGTDEQLQALTTYTQLIKLIREVSQLPSPENRVSVIRSVGSFMCTVMAEVTNGKVEMVMKDVNEPAINPAADVPATTADVSVATLEPAPEITFSAPIAPPETVSDHPGTVEIDTFESVHLPLFGLDVQIKDSVGQLKGDFIRLDESLAELKFEDGSTLTIAHQDKKFSTVGADGKIYTIELIV